MCDSWIEAPLRRVDIRVFEKDGGRGAGFVGGGIARIGAGVNESYTMLCLKVCPWRCGLHKYDKNQNTFYFILFHIKLEIL